MRAEVPLFAQPAEKGDDYNHRLINTFVTNMTVSDDELIIYFTFPKKPQTKIKTHLRKTLLKKVLLRCVWSEWRESNSRPLEPHSSALPKLRYTRKCAPPCCQSVATRDIILKGGAFVNCFLQNSFGFLGSALPCPAGVGRGGKTGWCVCASRWKSEALCTAPGRSVRPYPAPAGGAGTGR